MKCLCSFALLVALAATPAALANSLGNPGFEDPINFDGPLISGTWRGFSNGLPNSSATATIMPRTGNQHLELLLNASGGFAGVFQDVSVTAGDLVNFSVWAKDLGATNGAGVEMRFEYRNAAANNEVGRTGNFTPASLGSAYELITLNGVVPAGADIARPVFVIQSFGAAVPQTVYVDDARFTVPEPASAALAALTVAAGILRRRAR